MADQRWAQPGWPARAPGAPVTGLPPVPQAPGPPLRPVVQAGNGAPHLAPEGADPRWRTSEGRPERMLPALGEETRAALARVRVVDTQRPQEHGLDKCPHCGSTEIGYSITLRALYCSHCRQSWNEAIAVHAFGLNSPIAELRGHVLGSATANVREDASMVTVSCQGCGAQIVIKADEQLQTRCHWCRQKLSISRQVPSGAVPDAVLPFTVPRQDAVRSIEAFIGRKGIWAKSFVRRGFRPENVFGVYIPHLVVDGNIHAELHGTGEVQTRRYTVSVGDRSETRYDADVYQVDRSFDLLIDDLAVESSRGVVGAVSRATDHVVHAVAPYDTQNAVAYSGNYLSGFAAQRRDLDVRDVDQDVEARFLAIARARVLPTISGYDRGVAWTHEGVAVRGTRWVSVLVPIWLYSYQPPDDAEETHYIAVNGRSGVIQGSVPVSQTKMLLAGCLPALAVFGLGSLVLLLLIFVSL